MTARPITMRAALLTGMGGLDRLEVRDDVPVPHPGPGDVLIEVKAAGVNNTDINTRTGWYSPAVTVGTTAEGGTRGFADARADEPGWTGAEPTYPRIQGADACGIIRAVGADVAPSRIGERVLVEPVFRRPHGATPFSAAYFGSECDGAFAQFAVAPSVHAHAVRSALSDVELAAVPCAYSAAENMLTRAGLARGERVFITGASGGVGSAAIQLARCRGADIIAATDPAKADFVRALGAGTIVPRTGDPTAMLGAESVDVVVDLVGGPGFPALLRLLRRGGRYAVAGAIGGPQVTLDLRTLYLKDLRLLGCTVLDREVFPRLIGYLETGAIRPAIAATYPLAEIAAAQTAFLTKALTGKIVLIP